MENFRLQVISPKKIIFDGTCKMLEYNTTEGYVGVLPGHIAMTQVIAPGVLSIYEEGKEQPSIFALHSGIAKIMPDVVSILSEVIEAKEDIDIDRATKSLERAKKRIADKEPGLNMARANLSLMRAETRLKIAQLN